MRISDIQISRSTGIVELSGKVNDFRLWYRFPEDYAIPARADAFVAVALLPAMLAGEVLEVSPDLPVSGKLLENLPYLQEIYHCWNPVFRRIEVRANAADGSVANIGIGSFFSGGVDGTYTALKHAEITHLVLINGFDLFLEPPVFAQAVERNRSFAASLGKTLLTVETNFLDFNAAFGVSRSISFGTCLASVALGLAFRRAYVPSAGFTYAHLLPLGSHPLTDPLFSTEATEIVHDGAEASRNEKTKKIFDCDAVAQNLRVCWDDMNRNCGRCGKCLRTRMSLRALGISAPAFEELRSVHEIKSLTVDKWEELIFMEDSLRLAEQRGDRELARVLRAAIRRHDFRRFAVECDRLLLGGLLKAVKARFVKPERLRPGPVPDPNYPAEPNRANS